MYVKLDCGSSTRLSAVGSSFTSMWHRGDPVQLAQHWPSSDMAAIILHIVLFEATVAPLQRCSRPQPRDRDGSSSCRSPDGLSQHGSAQNTCNCVQEARLWQTCCTIAVLSSW
jgi:hypothetical protein